MPIAPETLMAYVDGELDADARREVDQALAGDPALAARLHEQQVLRRRIAAAYAAELDQPLAEGLQQALRGGAAAGPASGARVVDLATRRAAQPAPSAAPATKPAAGWGWRQWGGMAASLLVGVMVGRLALNQPDAGGVVAGAALAQALGEQLATASGATPVALRLSFVDRDGRYCRVFELPGQAGLACRSGDAWAVQALVAAAAAPAAAPGAALRQAASPLPAALLAEVDRRIAGDPLNAAAEAQARSQGWRR